MQADRHKCRTAPTGISDKLLTTLATAETALAGTSGLINWSAPRTAPGTLLPGRWPCDHHRRHADARSPSPALLAQWSVEPTSVHCGCRGGSTCYSRPAPSGRKVQGEGGGLVFIAFAIITGAVLALLTSHRWRSLRVMSRQVRRAETEKQRSLPMRVDGIGGRSMNDGEQRRHKLAACCRAGEMSDAKSRAVGYP
jgi:hypothetical protein